MTDAHGTPSPVLPRAEPSTSPLVRARLGDRVVAAHRLGDATSRVAATCWQRPPVAATCRRGAATCRAIRRRVAGRRSSTTAAGVPAEDRERVFEPMVRLDKTEPGTGIGLATCATDRGGARRPDRARRGIPAAAPIVWFELPASTSVAVRLARAGRASAAARPAPSCSVSRVDLDLVDDVAGDERLHRPHEVGQVDPVHRRAVADVAVEERRCSCPGGRRPAACTRLSSVPIAQRRAGGRGLDRLDDELGRADQVGLERRPRAWHSGCTRICDAGDAWRAARRRRRRRSGRAPSSGPSRGSSARRAAARR